MVIPPDKTTGNWSLLREGEFSVSEMRPIMTIQYIVSSKIIYSKDTVNGLSKIY